MAESDVACRARELVAAGRAPEAVDRLAALDDGELAAELSVLLRDLRHVAGEAVCEHPGRPDWPPEYADPFPELVDEVPEIPAPLLSTAMIGGAVAAHGCLLVRGLLSPAEAIGARSSLQKVLRRVGHDAPPDEWYHQFDVSAQRDVQYRKRVESNGGTWLADSPRMTGEVLARLRSVGVVDALTEHFGERPVFSLQKSTLRCMAPEERLTAWHQDGSFLDESVRTMNVWVALTPCGGDQPASGLEIVPVRMHEYLPLEPELAKAAVSFEAVEALDAPIARPTFEPGDALIFDERLLHRTDLGPGLTEDRYALECWFFAPSHVTERYTPFLV